MSNDDMSEIVKKTPGRPKKVIEDMRPEPISEAREEMRSSQREEDPRARAERRRRFPK
jgi:hypothetical protein